MSRSHERPGGRRGRLCVVCGLPGAGKTTLARRLEQTLCAVRLSPDEWMVDVGIDIFDGAARSRIERVQWKLAQRVLELGNPVVIEWGTWRRSERDTLRAQARELGALVELHYVQAPIDVLWQRVRERGMEQEHGTRALTRRDIESAARVFQPPDAHELSLYDPQTAVPDEPTHLRLPRGKYKRSHYELGGGG